LIVLNQQIEWASWFAWKASSDQLAFRREPFLEKENYCQEFDGIMGRLYMITTDIPKYLDQPKVNGLMVSTRRRLWDALDGLSLQYSAGAPIEQIREAWPHVLQWAEEYADFSHRFNQTAEAHGRVVAHVALRTEDYWIVALRLVCFGLLSGHGTQMPRVMSLIDYANDQKDGLIERLVAPFVPGRGEAPDKSTRHLPYRKLFKVFEAGVEKRPALMAKYLGEWYEASRREPYVDQHEHGVFYGYWSWEAAAVTWLLDIDDSSYRDMKFYPRDLVDFAKANAGSVPGNEPRSSLRLRCEAGQPCTREGWWFTPAQAGSRRRFQQGEAMPDLGGDYGVTIWQWDAAQ
jgi:hypothetical protein